MKSMKQHDLKAAWVDDTHRVAIMLKQAEGWDGEQTVIVAPTQLRAVCEHFGILARDEHAAKTIAAMQRRMQALRDRIDELGYYMTNFSDHKHADLTHELVSITALADLATEWCADFEDAEQDDGRSDVVVTSISALPPATAAQPEQATLI